MKQANAISKNIAFVLGILLISTLLSYIFSYLEFQEATIIIIYMLGVIIISQFTTHYVYGFIASLLSVLSFNFFFTHPLYTFNISQPDYLFTFFIMFIASFLSSSLTSKLKNEKRLSQLKTSQVLLVEAINHSFQGNDLNVALYTSINLIAENYDAEVHLQCSWGKHDYTLTARPNATINSSQTYDAEITLDKKCIGKLRMRSNYNLDGSWIQTLADLIGQNIDHLDLMEMQTQAKLEIREQKMRNDLLGAISHDLRTPLATIIGSSDTLLENLDQIKMDEQKELLENIKQDGQWLLNSVENILSFMRVEEGIKLNMNLESVEELFGDVLSRMVNRVPQKLILDLPRDPIYTTMDIQLRGKVLINLIDNASKNAPGESSIVLRAEVKNDRLIYEVIDEGSGVPEVMKRSIFERFASIDSVHANQRKGLGLGLAICKSIVEAHGGRIIVKDNAPQGSNFHCEFPYEGVQS
jgi:two-component system sensor histidine kinase KdpD